MNKNDKIADNFIYNNLLGFLNGTALYVMAAKIVLLYPNSTLTFWLKRFFLTYAAWYGTF